MNTIEEQEAFHFFKYQTAFELSGFFDSAFWQFEVLQASHTIPAIRHAIIAIAALHRKFISGRMPVVPDDLSDKQIMFAIEQSNRAIRELTKSSTEKTISDMMDLMTACIMFHCLSCFQGHQAAALEHLHSGLKILHQLDQVLDHQTDDLDVYPVSLKSLRTIFVTMDVQARGVMSKEMLETWAKRPKRNFSRPPNRFVTFAQARYAFEALYHELIGFMQALDVEPGGRGLPRRSAGGVHAVPIPFSVFPSSYQNVGKDAVKESTKVQVEAQAELPQAGREGHSEPQESFSVHVNQPAERPAQRPVERRETYTEDVRVFEDRQRRPQQHREEVHIHEEHRYRQPQQARRTERVEVDIHEHRDSRDRYPSQRPIVGSHIESHIEPQPRTYDSDFNAVHGAQPDYPATQVDVSERQFRERTRPIVGGHAHDSHNLTTQPNFEQASGHRNESFAAKHDTYPSRREVDAVDSRFPHREEVRVNTTRSTVDTPKKFKRDMGYYDDEGQYHSLRHGIQKAAHKVADHIAHPIHGSRHHHSHDHSSKASQHKDIREDIVVKEKYTTSAPAPASAPTASASAPAPTHFRDTHAYTPAPRAPASAPAPVSTYRPSAGPSTVSSSKTVTTRKMAPSNTITIPCHHIRIGDLLILQGRPCQVIRITTSSQTGQHRYLGVDLFTKQLHEESSFISNPSPSVVVQNMLGPVFKQYRVLDIREDGRVVAMTESGDVKQGLPILDQSNLLQRLTESFDNGRGSVRIMVINDDGLEMAVDYKVVHGSRL
ncbi:hypothetical protein P171DRAFT_490451 [Karstenula rhodostoma CBS 690.94]|uniref:Translation initiation factor 5A-like N-terminal domain-containing protein n=1 Tax=Karstenula rhodostoma CBS 690.94 TaxID=1392251 RepID=A0A9P4P5Z0_9PLEO|nr:hypothetical protein P171DRAFT_490451 [Karstenula rhodostoma CBS 690.94]